MSTARLSRRERRHLAELEAQYEAGQLQPQDKLEMINLLCRLAMEHANRVRAILAKVSA